MMTDENGKCTSLVIGMNPIPGNDCFTYTAPVGYFTVSSGVEIKCFKKSLQPKDRIEVHERRHKLNEANQLNFKLLNLKENQRNLWVDVEIVILQTA